MKFETTRQGALSKLDHFIENEIANYNFKRNFDILSHDNKDLHTDHQVCNEIMMGLLKLSDRFVTYYSPSSLNFEPNYFIELSKCEICHLLCNLV